MINFLGLLFITTIIRNIYGPWDEAIIDQSNLIYPSPLAITPTKNNQSIENHINNQQIQTASPNNFSYYLRSLSYAPSNNNNNNGWTELI